MCKLDNPLSPAALPGLDVTEQGKGVMDLWLSVFSDNAAEGAVVLR